MNPTKLETRNFPFSIDVHPGGATIESSIDFYRGKHTFTQFLEKLPKIAAEKIAKKYPYLWIMLKNQPLQLTTCKFQFKDGSFTLDEKNACSKEDQIAKISILMRYKNSNECLETINQGFTESEAQLLSDENTTIHQLKVIMITGYRELKEENKKMNEENKKMNEENKKMKAELDKFIKLFQESEQKRIEKKEKINGLLQEFIKINNE